MYPKKKSKKKKILACALIGCALVLGGCSTTTYNADGTVVKKEIDYQSVKLMSMATISAWAASQKSGIAEKDAEALYYLLDSIESYHADGTELDPNKWKPEIQKQVPLRYQGLALVLVELVSYEMKKYGLQDMPMTKGSEAQKLFDAIREGAMMGLAPYTGKGKMAA